MALSTGVLHAVTLRRKSFLFRKLCVLLATWGDGQNSGIANISTRIGTSGFHVTRYPSVNLHHQSVQTTDIILFYNAYNSRKPCRDPGTWSPASHRRSSNQFQAGSRVICGGRSVIRTCVSQNTSALPCHYHSSNARYSFTFHRRFII
jgi:hypothetical protein